MSDAALIEPNQDRIERAAQELLRRKSAQDSLHEFVRQAWPVLEPGYEFKDNWHVGALCEHLEASFYGEIRNLLINVPPRSLKTNLVSVAFPVWAWLQRPAEKFIYASYSYSLAEDASIKCRSLIRSRWFQARWGDRIKIAEDRDTKEYFAITGGGERITTSVDGTLTGRGGDCIVGDDLSNPKDQSDIMLENALHFWKTVLPSRLNDPKTGRKINVQQRVHEKDISGFILENMKDDWVSLILPMEFEPDRRCVTVPLKSTNGKPWRDPRTVEGELLHPARVGRKEVDRLKKELASEYAVAGQLQQRPAPTEGGILKRKWFRLWTQTQPPKLEFSLLSFDTALSESKAAAYSAATTWGVFRDEHGVPNIILLSVWRERCEYPELRERVKRMAVDYLDDAKEPRKSQYPKRPDMVLIEKKSSGHALVQDLLRADVVTVPFDPTKLGDKTQRVRLITPILESGRVWVPARGPDFTQPRDFAEILVGQAGMFPKGTSRDLVDTMTQALWKIQSGGWVWNPNDRAPAPENKAEREAFY